MRVTRENLSTCKALVDFWDDHVIIPSVRVFYGHPTHLNSSYFPAIVARSSVVTDGKKDSKVETSSPSWSACVVGSLY